MKIGRYKYEFDFFSWIKKTELVELDGVNPSDDPVRPELDNDFRTSKGRKIFGLKYKDDIEGIACFAFTNEIPATIKEMDLMSVEEDQASIPIAYTLWSFKKGAGKKIMKELQKYIKEKKQFESIVKDILKDKKPKAGSYRGRVNSEPEKNRQTLLETKNA